MVLIVIWVVIQRPISQLMGAMTRIEQGKLDVHCHTPARDEFGRLAAGINSMLLSLRDKNRELKLLNDTHMAQADRVASMGQLASGLAHEIKNPLHGISSALTVIRGRTDRDTALIIDEIQGQIARLVETVSDMLSYARPRESRFEICAVEQILLRTLALLNADIESHKIRLVKQIADEVPDTLLDREKIQQVYFNLILNAIQSTGDGGRVIVTLDWDQESNLIVSRVEDDGPGIPPDLAARVFEPFFTTKKQGHGLGLATSRMLIEQNNGTLELVSTPGSGACFRILLPVITALAPPPGLDDRPSTEGGDVAEAALDAYLFGLACHCPLGVGEDCPAEAIRRIRHLDLAERHEAIRKLTREKKIRSRKQHVECSFEKRKEGGPPPADVRAPGAPGSEPS